MKMIDLKAVVKKERAKLPMAGDPGNGKTSAELEKEILENHEAMLESATKESRAKAAKKKEESELLPVHTTKPIKEPVRRICPFCREEKSAQGMGRHIAAIHEAPGITLEDLNRIERGEITPDALATEKGATEIFGLSDEIDKKFFSDWKNIEENPEDPTDEKNPDNPGPPSDPSCHENPGNPGEKKGIMERLDDFLCVVLPPWW